MRALLVALTAAFAVLPAAGAHAALISTAACDGSALSTPFARWGDNALYKLAPGGDFESGLAGWSVSGHAAVVSGSEPWGVSGTVGAGALDLPAGASALSAPTCVNAGSPTFRFFARPTGGLLPVLSASLVYRDGLLGLVSLPLGAVLPTAGWQPTPVQLTLSVLPAALANGDVPLSIRFTAVSGHWQVDDFYVDPYARG
jgi:hypothetical protein